ncbi:hypothetical protein CASFOL_023341 [Castilleja foliolosa]|uniref:Uncharacterized protein n=1 Tax=Castilleja foliolosa TaxID=1961234 RepID=A0ABD3CLB3_9LAMI
MKKKMMINKDEMDQCISSKKGFAQKSCFITKTNKSNNAFDLLECYPFVETPLKFQFGNHEYGKQLFVDAHKQILYHNEHKASLPKNYSGDDVDNISTVTNMMNMFVKDNLFS